MKDIRNQRVTIRLTAEEKEIIRQLAEERNTTVSEVIRDLCFTIFNKKEER